MVWEAGAEILRKGGSAVDAAVAIQAMLGLVEPQSSGLGGGSFMMYYDARTKQVTALDSTIPYSQPMEEYILPDEDKIVGAVQQVLGQAPVTA